MYEKVEFHLQKQQLMCTLLHIESYICICVCMFSHYRVLILYIIDKCDFYQTLRPYLTSSGEHFDPVLS